jgi:hypothetical protein
LINWPPDFDGTSYKIFISALLLLPSWALLLPRCQKSSKRCLEKNINKRLINEKMRHHVKEMCQVYIAFVKAMILLIELGTGLTEIHRLPVMKSIW